MGSTCEAFARRYAPYMPGSDADYRELGFDKESLLLALVDQESGGDHRAVSDTGAKGCTQITLGAIKEMLKPHVQERLFNKKMLKPSLINDWRRGAWHKPGNNVFLGVSYLRLMSKRHGGNPYTWLKHYYGCGVERIPGHPQCEQYAQSIYQKARDLNNQKIANN